MLQQQRLDVERNTVKVVTCLVMIGFNIDADRIGCEGQSSRSTLRAADRARANRDETLSGVDF